MCEGERFSSFPQTQVMTQQCGYYELCALLGCSPGLYPELSQQPACLRCTESSPPVTVYSLKISWINQSVLQPARAELLHSPAYLLQHKRVAH